MKLTPHQRRERLLRMADCDPETSRMKEEYEKGRAWFEKATRWMPRLSAANGGTFQGWVT